ncbi:MAG: pyridoxal phosphate-dependent aminotransferase [Alphaproteobacteria bacterium]|jgi:aspartate aminotransferase|nr:pyridoxal phosphate-dependent aminotransferase [Alphaproteobacteria bacterium]
MQLADNLNNLGTETAFEVLARAAKLAAAGKDVINLGIGQPDFKTPGHVVEAAIKAMRDGHHGYTPAKGIPELREAVAADTLKRRGAVIDPENIMIMPGGKPTMFFAVMMFAEPGAEIIYPNPGFPIYESVIRYAGATPVPMRLLEEKGFAFSADEVLSQITPKTRLIIMNTPANPTGGVTPKEELDKLAAGLAEWPNVVVMSDEIYDRMLYDGRQHASMLAYEDLRDRLIVLNGWSKTYAMTGWRLGYSIWPERLIGHVEKLAVNCHSCVNAPTQFAGIAALNGPQDEVDGMLVAFDKRRRLIVDALNALPGVRCAEPGGAFYAFPNITGTGMDAKALQTQLLEQAGVAVVAGTSFGALGEGFIRFSYAASAEQIEDAMGRMQKLLERAND